MTACAHPSDDECIALFMRHEREFERLREMAAAAPGNGGGSTAAELIDKIGLRDGMVRLSREPLRIEFELSVRGLATSSSSKLIYYSETEPAPLVPKLDDVGAVRRTCHCDAAFRMIDGNWYIKLGL